MCDNISTRLSDISTRLDFFLKTGKIPNIIFHGEHGSGKKTMLFQFINSIYKDNKMYIKENVMTVNCAHGKGIKFVREDLKQFAKSNIICKNEIAFKSIVLLNADTLTIDAQSALRRCIELFTNSTRFFVVVETAEKLLKPILSRFCHMFFFKSTEDSFPKPLPLEKENKLMKMFHSIKSNTEIIENVDLLYSQGISALDVLFVINHEPSLLFESDDKTRVSFVFGKLKREFRNEKQLLYFLLNLFFLSLNECLENITFI